MLKLPMRLMTTTKKMVRVMIVARHQHSDAQAKTATCILIGDKLLLGENHLFRVPTRPRAAEMARLLFLQHYDRGRCAYSKKYFEVN
jgi:hypothetical protein